MTWMKLHKLAAIELDLSFRNLNPIEKAAVQRARTSLPDGYAPQTLNHRAAAIIDNNEKILSVSPNTDAAQRGKQCAELTAFSLARVELQRRGWDRITLGALAVMSKRYTTNNSSKETSQKEPPAGPCGTCLTHIQAQKNYSNLSELTVIMGAGNNFRRAIFRDLYPLSTVSSLVSSVNDRHVLPAGIAIAPALSCCDALGQPYAREIPQERFNTLLGKVHDELKFSAIKSAPNLQISFGYLTQKSGKVLNTAPLIDDGSPIGHVSGLLSLCASSQLSRNVAQRIKALVIAVDFPRGELGVAGDYQFFPGTERQRIFDLADLTHYDIPVFISWQRQHLLVAHISALAPLFEGPRASGSSAKNLPYYS